MPLISDRANRLNRELTSYWSSRGGGIGSELAGGRDSNSMAVGGPGVGPEVESAAAARRRADRALAEQRRADLELLEARRQQRKLNFLLAQTELYAHFMAKTLGNASINVTAADNDVKSILERLQEVPKSNEESGNPESTLAEAAKAAAGRLGIKVDDEFGRVLHRSLCIYPCLIHFSLFIHIVSLRY